MHLLACADAKQLAKAITWPAIATTRIAAAVPALLLRQLLQALLLQPQRLRLLVLVVLVHLRRPARTSPISSQLLCRLWFNPCDWG